jgi:type I restriction enzyme S subunit
VLIGRYGASVGKILTRLQGAYNVALIKTIPDHTQLNQRFLYYYLHSATFQHRLRNGASRSAQNGFSKDDIFDFPIPLPRLEEQARVVDKLELNSYETQRLESLYRRKLAALDELKKSLLQRAFSGEL